MSPDFIPQINLGTAVLIIFVLCIGFLMLRGVTRMIIGSIVLALSAWISFLIWQESPTLSIKWFGKSIGWITTGLPITVFFLSFFFIQKILKIIASPFVKDSEPEKSSSTAIIRVAFRLLLALVPTFIICLIGATLVHHTGSIAEIRAYSEKILQPKQTTEKNSPHRLKSSIESALPASWIKMLDPLAAPSRLNLAKLITAQAESPLKPVIDPRTGLPIPRAIIVDDPELQNLARQGKFGTLLRHPLLTKALEDPQIQALLNNLNL